MGIAALKAIGMLATFALIYYLANRERPHYLQTDIRKPGEKWHADEYEPEPTGFVQVAEHRDPPAGPGGHSVQITDLPPKS